MFFFDTYAIIEIARGSESHQQFSESPLVTTAMNVSEVYYIFATNYGEKQAKELIQTLQFSLIDIKQEHAVASAQFRFANRKKKFSYVDCLGYTIAREQGLIFVTGDDAFANEPGVVLLK